MIKNLLIPVFALSLLGGCSAAKEEYTADYLFEHDDIRNKVLDDCKSNKQTDTNCKNANLAKARKFNSVQGKEPLKTKPIAIN